MQNLHSRYNPVGEAERFLDSLDLKTGIRFFILIEPGMGYLSACLRKRNPNARIIALYAQMPPPSSLNENEPDTFWYPGLAIGLRSYLEQEIPDIEAYKIKIIEWRPALAAYGEAYRYLLSETADFIKHCDASARTQNRFGRKWLKNFFRNLLLLSDIIDPGICTIPFLITGAGPGLEQTIPLIINERKKIFLLAVSSSAASLREAGIVPDLVLSTDGTGWALLHLYECFRRNSLINSFAASLTAAIPSQCTNAPLLIISDNSLWQNLLLKELRIPYVALPQRGTVTATALDLALALTNDRVFFTGMDLAQKDIQSHARPYSFDRLWEEKAGRFNPVYSQVFNRSESMRKGNTHAIYASWFSRQLSSYPKRLFSLGANNQVFKTLETSGAGIIPDTIHYRRPLFNHFLFRFDGNPALHTAGILKNALTSPIYGRELCNELSSLLFPDQSPSVEELGDAIFSLNSALWKNDG